jgi:hypothetical protein
VSYKKEVYCMCLPDQLPKLYDRKGQEICTECNRLISEERLWQNAMDMWIKSKDK